MSWLSGLLDLLYPARCALCGELLTGKGPFCAECAGEAPFIPPEEMVREEPWGRCASVLYYEGAARQAVRALKFHGESWRARALGTLMAQAAAECLGGEFDTVTWAPVSRKRLGERCYDQSRLLAEAMCRPWDLRPVPLLRKTADTPAQSSLGEAERRENVKGVYAGLPAARGRRVLLADDVLTTGSTLGACVRALEEAGAASVVCVTLAAGRRRGPDAADFPEIRENSVK